MSSSIVQANDYAPLALPDGVRELSLDEIALVSGAFSFTELYASAFAGAITGGIGGLTVGGLAGVAPGALAGAVGGASGYMAYQAWMYCFG